MDLCALWLVTIEGRSTPMPKRTVTTGSLRQVREVVKKGACRPPGARDEDH